ncbi:AsmA family protein [Microvirga antarctica]|uniref:AsmA family protein n=1 Tax=Microvirga antarctica TaxID=2819233 RepID=UPI001B3111A5|nr:AsmA-like C-terminal region-containing protein [Microvirga antarctica]
MSRRAVLSIAVVCLLVLAVAAVPWTLPKGGLSARIASHLKQQYDIDFAVSGRSTFALLPTPRIKFEDVHLEAPGPAVIAQGGTLRAELNIIPLFLGRLEMGAISLSESKLSASFEQLRRHDWSGAIADEAQHMRLSRVVIAGSTLRWTDRPDDGLSSINAILAWAALDDTLSAVGSFSWRGETVAVEQAQFQPLALSSDRPGALSFTLALPAARVSVDGTAQLGSDPRFTGKSQIKATSVRDFTRWSGLDLPFGSLLKAVSVDGMLSFDRRRLSWPSVTVKLGPDALEGTLAVRLDGERPLITGTLAADEVDFSDVVMPLSSVTTSAGTWSDEVIDLSSATGSDLDLRLSATTAQLGRMRLGDMAMSVLVRPGRVEASLGRGTFHDGTLKGRLSLTRVDEGTELRAQGAFDRVDMAAFLAATGQGRWIQGPGQGQFAIEGTGRTPSDLVRHANGRSTVTIKDGELIGIGLDEAIRRVEKRPLAASLGWKGGRTPFDQAQVQFNIVDGLADIADSRLTASGFVTTLRGQISLIERDLDLKADVSAASATTPLPPAIVFGVSGRWHNVIVTPDARSLIERSGAAKPLFGQAHPLATSVMPRPIATSQ